MKTYYKPNATIIQQGDDMFTILHVAGRSLFTNKENVINKTHLGYMVKWCGGNHVIQHNDQLIICSKIEDTQYETVQ